MTTRLWKTLGSMYIRIKGTIREVMKTFAKHGRVAQEQRTLEKGYREVRQHYTS